MTSHGQPDQSRSARYILKDYVNVSANKIYLFKSTFTCSIKYIMTQLWLDRGITLHIVGAVLWNCFGLFNHSPSFRNSHFVFFFLFGQSIHLPRICASWIEHPHCTLTMLTPHRESFCTATPLHILKLKTSSRSTTSSWKKTWTAVTSPQQQAIRKSRELKM